MRAKTKLITILGYPVVILILILSACDSFTEVELPNSQLTGISVFEELSTADAAMRNIYASLRDEGVLTGQMFGLSNSMGAYTDELNFYGSPSLPTYYFYTNNIQPLSSQAQLYWNLGYNQIYNSNALIAGVQASSGLTTPDKDRLRGEALFVRALVHFYLVNLYGNIPYVSDIDYITNSVLSRQPVTQVYTRIATDLEEAIELLPEAYSNPLRVRANKSAARALLARVYLYAGKWLEADNEASGVLNSTSLYSLETDLNNVFLKASSETILQFQTSVEGRPTFEATTFTIPPGATPTTVAISTHLINAFPNEDLRKVAWTGSSTAGSQTYYFARKYKQNGVLGTSSEYSVVMRLAEQYLIRAEARARQGELTGAKEDLNIIRLRAGLAPTTATTQEEILNAILEERRLELFTEHGHRFFDLKRFNLLDSALSGIKVGWNSTDRLLPIPEGEISLNPNLLPQNPGY